ncbi:MAG: anti-sigma factor family protein [Planctomycetia bacterium]
MNHDRRDPPIAPDDPRLSEWLDGRLPAAEAAEIERIVAASPELTRLVEDLRGMRGALAAVPTTPPPAGFVRDLLAAIDVAGDGAAEEAEVEAEWRRIERQRLEGEIAEARDDAADPAPEPMRQRWPWIALAGALAAGVLVAVVIDRPRGPADREVALVEQQAARRQANEAAESAKQALEPRVADKWLEETQEASEKLAAAAAAPAREQAAEAAAVAEPKVRTVTYRIQSAADRERLHALVAASAAAKREPMGQQGHRAANQMPSEANREQAKPGSDAMSFGGRKSGSAAERIEISGPAAAIASLVDALAATQTDGRDRALGFAAKEKAEVADATKDLKKADSLETLRGAATLAQSAGDDGYIRLVIEVIDETDTVAGEGEP